jgi:hypothetical protein
MNDFWADAEIISTYTDNDAIEDGIIIDISDLKIYFNQKIITRITIAANQIVSLSGKPDFEAKETLQHISTNAKYDGTGEDAWGIVKIRRLKEKLWLIPNEHNGYTLMLPSDY